MGIDAETRLFARGGGERERPPDLGGPSIDAYLHSTVAVTVGISFASAKACTAVTGIWTQIPSPTPARI